MGSPPPQTFFKGETRVPPTNVRSSPFEDPSIPPTDSPMPPGFLLPSFQGAPLAYTPSAKRPDDLGDWGARLPTIAGPLPPSEDNFRRTQHHHSLPGAAEPDSRRPRSKRLVRISALEPLKPAHWTRPFARLESIWPRQGLSLPPFVANFTIAPPPY